MNSASYRKFTRRIGAVIKMVLVISCSQMVAGMTFVIYSRPVATNDGQVAHWTFDHDFSSAESGSYCGGSPRGAPVISTDTPAFGAGFLFLNNSGSTVSGLVISNANRLAIGTNSWTATFWMRRVGQAPSSTGDNYGTPLAAGWNMYVQDRGTPREIRTYSTNALLVSNPARAAYVAPTGTWSFVAVVFDRPAMTNRIYRYNCAESNPELVLEKESALQANYNVSFAEFTIGFVCTNSPTDAFDGYLDDVRIYDHALNSLEIENLIGMPGGASSFPWQTDYVIYNPTQMVDSVVCDYDSPYNNTNYLRYKHCSVAVKFQDKWIAMFTGNLSPKESEPGQKIYMSVSTNGMAWPAPELAFASTNRSANAITCINGVQWQPNFILSADSNQLWCFWSQLSTGWESNKYGSYFSILSSPTGKWTNTRLLWDSNPDVVIGTNKYRVFPTQNPVRLSGGRVLVPGILFGSDASNVPPGVTWTDIKRASVLYSDNEGSTWQWSAGVTIPDKEWAPWEATVWERPNGNVGMMFRCNNNLDSASINGISPAEALWYSESNDGGITWLDPIKVPLDGLVSLMQVNRATFSMGIEPATWDRYIMAYNDWPHQQPVGKNSNGRDRFGLSLFFNRGGGSQFVPGLMFSDYRLAGYPKIWMDGNSCRVSWSTGIGNNSIRITQVSPLPDINTNYVFPRKRAYNDTYRPALETNGLYRFQGEQYISCNNTVAFGTKFSIGAWVYHSIFGPIADTKNSQGTNSGVLFRGYRTQPALDIPGIGIVSPGVPTNTGDTSYAPKAWPPNDEWYYWGVSCDLTNKTVDFYVRGLDLNSTNAAKEFYWHRQTSFTGTVNLPALANMQLGRTFLTSNYTFSDATYSGFWGKIRLFEFYTNTYLTEANHNHLFNKCRDEFGFNAAGPSTAPSPGAAVYYNPIDYNLDAFTLPSESWNGTYSNSNNILYLNGQMSSGLDVHQHEIIEGDVVDVAFSFQAFYNQPGTVFTCGDYNNQVRLKYNNGRLYLASSTVTNDCGAVLPTNEWNRVEMFITRTNVSARLNHIGNCITISSMPDALWMFLGEGYRDDVVSNVMASTSRMAYDISTVQTRVREYAHKIGWWRFNNNALDFSGYGNTAVLRGGAGYAKDTRNSALDPAALVLDGNGDYAEASNVVSVGSAVTVACWAKSDAATWNATGGLISRCPAFVLYPVVDTKTLRFGIWNTQSTGLWKTVEYDLGAGFDIQAWHHYAGTFSQSTGLLKLYVDGSCRATNNIGSVYGINYDSGPIFIGRDETSESYFAGKIDDVRLFDVVLNEDAIYRQAYGIKPD